MFELFHFSQTNLISHPNGNSVETNLTVIEKKYYCFFWYLIVILVTKVDDMMFLKNLVIDDFIVFVNGSF